MNITLLFSPADMGPVSLIDLLENGFDKFFTPSNRAFLQVGQNRYNFYVRVPGNFHRFQRVLLAFLDELLRPNRKARKSFQNNKACMECDEMIILKKRD